MAYLGNAPARSFISFERQVFTIVNSQTAYTLSHSVNNENDIRLVINNIVQEPGSGKAYTASGTTLTLSAALTNGTDEMYCVFLGRAVATNAPAAGSVNTAAIADLNVTTAKIADSSVTTAKINDGAVSLAKLTATGTKDATTFLRGDNTFAEAGGGGKILQVQHTNSTTFISTTSTAFQDLVTVNITPSATTSTILLMGSVGEPDQLDGRLQAYFHRGSTSLGGNNDGGRIVSEMGRNLSNTGSETHRGTVSQMMVDNPGTTSQITYSIKVRSGLGSTIRVGNGGSSNIIAMEIGA